MPATIRPCAASDLPAATAFLAELYRHRPEDAHLDELPNRLSEFALVAEKDGQVVGLLVAEKRATRNLRDEIGRDAFPNDERYLEIQDVFVRQDERGEGIGTALVRSVLQRAQTSGVARALVYSGNADYARIARFYERCGFRMWHIFMTQ
jgi:GNAT superfamily N-acetyltransferase